MSKNLLVKKANLTSILLVRFSEIRVFGLLLVSLLVRFQQILSELLLVRNFFGIFGKFAVLNRNLLVRF